MNHSPNRLLLLNVDALAPSVFKEALQQEQGLLGHVFRASPHFVTITTAPSVTFTAQTSLITGAPPREHGITGNQYLERASQIPRYRGFDIGETYDLQSCFRTFLGRGLVNELLPKSIQTLYEAAAAKGVRSFVVNNMVSRGASKWLTPHLFELARLTKGKGILKIAPADFDKRMIKRSVQALAEGTNFDLMSFYFKGVDSTCHELGFDAQSEYVKEHLFPQLSLLLERLQSLRLLERAIVAVVSDHSQIFAGGTSSFRLRGILRSLCRRVGRRLYLGRSSLRVADTVVGMNGGLAHVFVRGKDLHWNQPASFKNEILPFAVAARKHFGESLSAIMVRNVEGEGWHAPYLLLDPEGKPQDNWAEQSGWRSARTRLHDLSCAASGDILLISNIRNNCYFGGPLLGMHGGLEKEESEATFAFGLGYLKSAEKEILRNRIAAAVEATTGSEREADAFSICHVKSILCKVMNWE